MKRTTIFLLVLLHASNVTCGIVTKKQGKMICSEIPQNILEEILGASFNARYMSISEPKVTLNGDQSGKRTTQDEEFFVDQSYGAQLTDLPAWEVKNHVKIALGTKKVKRELPSNEKKKRSAKFVQEWHCESKIVWKDLGPDYFPRYLRSVECSSSNCWFNIYKCKPRSFSVKILKRKRSKCVLAEPGTKIGTSGLPKELKELWVWEEHAVNFCCDCSF